MTVSLDLECHYYILYHPQIVPVLVAQSVVSKSVQGSKNMAQTPIILGHSTISEHTLTIITHRILPTSYKNVHNDLVPKQTASIWLIQVENSGIAFLVNCSSDCVMEAHHSNCPMMSLIVGLLVGSRSMHCRISATMAGCCTRWRRASHSSGLGNLRLHISSRRTP